jgi:2-octaprenyl-6-methoxyphenol hydroxylase
MDNHKFSEVFEPMKHNAEILIIGGGLNGLGLSTALGSAGLDIILIDDPAYKPDMEDTFNGRAYALALASQSLLKALGLWAIIEPNAQPILDIKVTDGTLDKGPSPFLMHFDHKEINTEAMGYMIEDNTLRNAFYGQIKRSSNIKIISNKVINHSIHPGKAHITLENCDTIEASIILACDGRLSSTAKRAGISRRVKEYNQSAIVTTVTHEQPHMGIAYQYFMPSGPLAILPLQKNRSSIVWALTSEHALKLSTLDDKKFSKELRFVFGDFLGCFNICSERFTYPLNMTVVDSFIADRLALVGDAAHGIHPIAGQGLNLGLRDVASIAEILVDAYRRGEDLGAPYVLERYEQWRLFDSTLLSTSTDLFNSLFSNNNSYLRLARGLGMGLINNSSFLKRSFIKEAAGLNGDLPRLLKGQPL